MENFSPGLCESGLKLQPGILIKLLLKMSCHYMTRTSACRADISHVIDFKFQPGLKNYLLGKKIRIKTKFKMAKKSQSPCAEESFKKNLKPRFT